jgi:hypothetical protein
LAIAIELSDSMVECFLYSQEILERGLEVL